MKKAVLCFAGALMILSLAACTPTTEKHKTGEVAQTEADSGPGVMDKGADPDAPKLEIISIYTVSGDGSGLEGTMDGVETKDAQSLTDMLIQYGVLAEGTKALSFETDGAASSQEAGPGVSADAPEKMEHGVLDLSQAPEGDLALQAVANTFIENMNVEKLDILVNGETAADGLTFVNPGK
ncbi:MAG: hypothetical protein Q4C73_10560 [Eubacteriales bacterium]|nr:hypothetical protein [Eubacteriales bacterium]